MAPLPATRTARNEVAGEEFPIDELPSLAAEYHDRQRQDTDTTLRSSTASIKQDDHLVDEEVGQPRRTRRDRSSSWITKWSRQRRHPGDGISSSDATDRSESGHESPLRKPGLAPPSRDAYVLAPVGPWQQRFDDWLEHISTQHERVAKTLTWLRGPSPARIETNMAMFPLPFLGPLLFRLERWCTVRLQPLERVRRATTPLFFLAWLVAFIFLVRASFFTSNTTAGQPDWLVSTSTFWTRNDGCGINGTSCEPFSGFNYTFRCPGQTLSTKLLNYRAIGSEQVIFEPLVVGGMDPEGTYRADSWVCAAAIHRGLFRNQRGGCGELAFIGEFTGFEGGKKNGVDSVGFPSTFPSSFRFLDEVDQDNCKDLRNDILGFDVAMTIIFSFFIRYAHSYPR